MPLSIFYHINGRQVFHDREPYFVELVFWIHFSPTRIWKLMQFFFRSSCWYRFVQHEICMRIRLVSGHHEKYSPFAIRTERNIITHYIMTTELACQQEIRFSGNSYFMGPIGKCELHAAAVHCTHYTLHIIIVEQRFEYTEQNEHWLARIVATEYAFCDLLALQSADEARGVAKENK